MLRLFSRSKPAPAITAPALLKTDMHSHLIPGIDDGSPDIETSLQLVQGMAELGYEKLITTPHIMWDMYKNSRQAVLDKLEQLRTAVKAKGLAIEINGGAEYFLDDYVSGLLKTNEPLLSIGGNMVLVEFSMASSPMGLKDILFEMQMQGYLPVIAHPERYIYLEHSRTFYEELKDIGCLFQLNLLSLGNYYGKSVHELAGYLIKKGYYDLVGSDLHHARHLEALADPSLVNPLKKLLDSGRIRNQQL